MDSRLIFFLQKHYKNSIMVGLLFAAFGFFFIILFDRGSVARADFILVQPNVSNQDFYTSFKSAEYLSKVLGQAVTSERFMQASLDTGKMDESILPSAANMSDRLTAWSRMVSVNRNDSLGMISLQVKGKTDREAYKTMQAATQVFTEQNAMFRGGDEKSIEVRLLSGPIVKPTPEPQTLVLFVLGTFVFGFLVASVAFYLRERRDNGAVISMGTSFISR